MRRILLATMCLSLTAGIGTARADTVCQLGGPTPSFKAIKLHLPQGSSYLGIELLGTRNRGPIEDGSSWHFARGILVLDANMKLAAFRIANSGTSPKSYVASADGERVAAKAPGVDGPFIHQASSLPPRLNPGTYYAIGFGVDGDSANHNEYWGVTVRVQGSVSCASVGVGETIDLSHVDAESEAQLYVPNLGVAKEGVITHSTSRQISVGLIDCSVQFGIETAEQAECDADLADGTHLALEDEIVPFVTAGGTSTIKFEHAGVAPIVAMSGASFDWLA